MQAYQQLLRRIVTEGIAKEDRTGTGTLSVFGHSMRFDLQQGFPLVTTKKIHLKSVIHELLWFLRGETNIQSLNAAGVRIWNEWADSEGNLGPVYGQQWRAWRGADGKTHDQIANAVQLLKEDPNSRRNIVCAWNVGELQEMHLMPCHTLFQFYVVSGRLSLALYQRSADCFLGVPFNIASYAMLVQMMSQVTNLVPGEFVHFIGDAHLYRNHLPQVELQLQREPYPLPQLQINPAVKNIFEFQYEDFTLLNYQAHPHIKGEVAV